MRSLKRQFLQGKTNAATLMEMSTLYPCPKFDTEPPCPSVHPHHPPPNPTTHTESIHKCHALFSNWVTPTSFKGLSDGPDKKASHCTPSLCRAARGKRSALSLPLPLRPKQKTHKGIPCICVDVKSHKEYVKLSLGDRKSTRLNSSH